VPKRILIVEDDPLTRKHLGVFLREEGYEVNEAKDGAEALDLLNELRFDLVLSDVRMPRVDGIAVVSHLRSISPQTPSVLMTAYPDDAIGLSRIPTAILLTKPVLFPDLQAKIRHLLER
jgi:CheY-like chemotaxis protein